MVKVGYVLKNIGGKKLFGKFSKLELGTLYAQNRSFDHIHPVPFHEIIM